MKLHKIAVLFVLLAASFNGFAADGVHNTAEEVQQKAIARLSR